MQQQSLELNNEELNSLKKRVTELELRIAVHEKECQLNNKMFEKQLKEISDKEAETKNEVIKSRDALKNEMDLRFNGVNKKLWAGLVAASTLALSFAVWSFTQLWNDSKPDHYSNYQIIRVYKI